MYCWTRIMLVAGMICAAHAQTLENQITPDDGLPDSPNPASAMISSGPSHEMQAGIRLMALQDGAAPESSGWSADVSDNTAREESAGTANTASPYVKLDSWIYAAFDRLTAMGYAESGSAIIRPWTRLECARLLAEAHAADEGDEATHPIFAALDAEFAFETSVIDGASNRQVRVETVYSRFTEISGTPLRDSYHFGQTLADDFGRPYGQGANEVSGFSAWGSTGMFTVYFRGEHQYAPTILLYNAVAQNAIAASDSTSVVDQMTFGWNLRMGTTDRLRPVEAYVAANVANWQISFGQQALWWGPDRSTSLILSNNAASLPMLRFARVKPIRLPSLLSWFGPLHFDGFFAREGGVHYVALGPSFDLYGSSRKALTPPPYIWGAVFSVKPAKNLELGFAHTVIFAGYGRSLNLRTFLHTFSIAGNGQAVDPGKRVTEFNLQYHVPVLRRNLVAYTEGMAWDDPVEGKFVARFAMDPGLYLPSLPKLKKVDLRMEGAYTDLPKLSYQAYFYSNAHYVEGYTNYGQVMGSWIGRQGRGGQATSTYWVTTRNRVALSYRKMTADKSFLEGGNLSDLSGSVTWMVRPDIELSGTGQYENWKFPLLSTGRVSNFSTIFSLVFLPEKQLMFKTAN